MKILILFTGGTIGSSVSNGYITPNQGNGYKLLSLYREKCSKEKQERQNVSFETLQPFETLSENMTCDLLLQLIDCVTQEAKKGYDGMILCHGTDTLQYSAAALGYALGQKSIPILLVSSNYILEDERAKGLRHFAASVDFICEGAGRGVFVTYQNDGETVKIHRATRVLPHPPYSDSILSIFQQHYGEFVGDVLAEAYFQKNAHYQEKEDEMQPLWTEKENCAEHRILTGQKGRKEAAPSLQGNTEFSQILQIYPSPGFQYPKLAEANKSQQNQIKAILHHSYHSGTICSKTPGLAEFVAQAKAAEIPVFLTGANVEKDYESAKIFQVLKIQVLPQASPIAMYMKLWLCLYCKRAPGEAMAKSLGGDVTEDKGSL